MKMNKLMKIEEAISGDAWEKLREMEVQEGVDEAHVVMYDQEDVSQG